MALSTGFFGGLAQGREARLSREQRDASLAMQKLLTETGMKREEEAVERRGAERRETLGALGERFGAEAPAVLAQPGLGPAIMRQRAVEIKKTPAQQAGDRVSEMVDLAEFLRDWGAFKEPGHKPPSAKRFKRYQELVAKYGISIERGPDPLGEWMEAQGYPLEKLGEWGKARKAEQKEQTQKQTEQQMQSEITMAGAKAQAQAAGKRAGAGPADATKHPLYAIFKDYQSTLAKDAAARGKPFPAPSFEEWSGQQQSDPSGAVRITVEDYQQLPPGRKPEMIQHLQTQAQGQTAVSAQARQALAEISRLGEE